MGNWKGEWKTPVPNFSATPEKAATELYIGEPQPDVSKSDAKISLVEYTTQSGQTKRKIELVDNRVKKSKEKQATYYLVGDTEDENIVGFETPVPVMIANLEDETTQLWLFHDTRMCLEENPVSEKAWIVTEYHDGDDGFVAIEVYAMERVKKEKEKPKDSEKKEKKAACVNDSSAVESDVAAAGGGVGGRSKRPREEKESGVDKETDASTHVKKPRKTQTVAAAKKGEEIDLSEAISDACIDDAKSKDDLHALKADVLREFMKKHGVSLKSRKKGGQMNKQQMINKLAKEYFKWTQ